MRDVLRTFVHFHSTIKLLLLGNILLFIGISMSSPFLAIYLAQHLGLPSAVIGVIIGSGAVAGIIGGFIGGVMSDRFGHKPLLVLSLLFSGVIFCGYTLVNQAAFFAILVFSAGFSNSVFQTVSRTVIAELTQKQERNTAFSFSNFTLNVGWALGPLIASVLDLAATTMPFLIAGVIFCFYGFLLLAALRPTQPVDKQKSNDEMSFRQVLSMIIGDSALRKYLMGGILLMTGWGQFTILLSQYVAKEFANGTSVFSIMLAINALFIVIFQLPLSSYTASKKSSFLIKRGIVLVALGLVGFGISSTSLMLYAAMVIFSLAEAIVTPLQSTILDEIASPEHKGAYFGAQNLTFLGLFLSPIIGGYLLDHYGGFVMYLSLASIAVVSMFFFLMCLKQSKSYVKTTLSA
ncbi:MFS transporter [Brevibacillus ginsengisoli]|uniref:MFS transporter n=1 Tax=Brevibacillus ginsengisoli TaxID=363854 RepID=UPI003CF3F5C1